MARRLVIGACAAIAVLAVALFIWPLRLLSHGAASPVISRAATHSPVAVALSPSPPASSSATLDLSPGEPVPADGAATCQRLVTGTPQEQRAALTPQLAAMLPAGPLFPSGAMLALDATGWHRSGDYANATGTVRHADGSSQRVEIGLSHHSGSWLVTFEEELS